MSTISLLCGARSLSDPGRGLPESSRLWRGQPNGLEEGKKGVLVGFCVRRTTTTVAVDDALWCSIVARLPVQLRSEYLYYRTSLPVLSSLELVFRCFTI